MRYYSSKGSLILRGSMYETSSLLLVGDGVVSDLDPIHVFNLLISLVMATNYFPYILKLMFVKIYFTHRIPFLEKDF